MKDYKDCLRITCSRVSDACHLNEYKKYPSIKTFQAYLLKLLTDFSVYEIEYGVWTDTDRSTLLTIRESSSDFVENLGEKLIKLKPHSFIAKKQSEFISNRKSKLSQSEVMVHFDFSENYPYVAQDASQAFHYNNDQSTVFPVIYYYKKNSEIVHRSCIFLSECTKHDTAAVYTVLQQLIPEIKKHVPLVKKVIYVSDGAKQHFKNKYQMSNLKKHQEDFQLDAEGHFTPTAHGKGGIDGVGASYKREARRASLKAKPTEAILDIKSLVNWSKKHYTGDLNIFYFSQSDRDRCMRKLNSRFTVAEAVTGIMMNHSFRIIGQNKLEMKKYSTM